MLINGVDVDSLAQSFGYGTDGAISYIEIKVPTGEGLVEAYRQNFTYVSGKLTKISEWIKQ